MPRRIFATVVTHTVPSSNHRGENDLNRTVLQKVFAPDGRPVPYFSGPSIRNGARETAAAVGLPLNRSRVEDANQPTVAMRDYPNAGEYWDDFVLGYMVAAGDADRTRYRAEIVSARGDGNGFTFKRNSLLSVNIALALNPYRHDTTLLQSPKILGPWRNADQSALVHAELALTSFQYPFCLEVDPFTAAGKREWGPATLDVIAQLSHVAGNHARSLFTFDPASVVARLTDRQVPEFDPYGFTSEAEFPDVVDALTRGDLPGGELYLGGSIVKAMTDDQKESLARLGVTLDRSPRRLLALVGKAAFPGPEGERK
jgi:CRISPR-associated protein Cst2